MVGETWLSFKDKEPVEADCSLNLWSPQGAESMVQVVCTQPVTLCQPMLPSVVIATGHAGLLAAPSSCFVQQQDIKSSFSHSPLLPEGVWLQNILVSGRRTGCILLFLASDPALFIKYDSRMTSMKLLTKLGRKSSENRNHRHVKPKFVSVTL